MSSQRSVFSELIHRRIFQLMGLYVAGVWMAIEIGDWLIDQFALPARLTAYIFVFLALMLPTVALLAWIYGAPGKDRSSAGQRAFIGVNLAVAIAAVLFVPQRNDVDLAPVSAVQASVDAPAPPSAVSKRMAVFFMQNNTAAAPDWYGYAVPFLINSDITRASAAFTTLTPFDSGTILERLRQVDRPRALGEPLSVQREIARDGQYELFLRGEIIDAENAALAVQYSLHDSATGNAVVSDVRIFDDETLLDVIDDISAAVQAQLVARFDEPPEVADLPVEETMGASLDAIRHFTEAKIAGHIDQDQATALQLLDQAIAEDPQFSEAHAQRGLIYYLSGNSQEALTSLSKALDYPYRLSTESRYIALINRSIMSGEQDDATEIARTWTEVEPNSETAFRILAQLTTTFAVDLDRALAALARVREINPAATNTLLQSANIELQRGNFDAATAFAERYVAARPDSSSGLTRLAEIQAAAGEFDAAIESYRKAGFLDSNSLTPELGRISVMMRRGDFATAEDRLEALSQRDMTDQQRIQVLNTEVSLYTLTGRYRAAVEAMRENDEVARRFLPPLIYMFQVQAPSVVLAAIGGDDVDTSLAALAEIRDGLQPPWDAMTYWFELSIHKVREDAAAYASALEMAETFLQSQSNEAFDLMLFEGKAQAAVFDGDFATAIGYAESGLEQSESSMLNTMAAAEALAMRAGFFEILRQAGEAERAVLGLQAIVESFPGHALAHLYLALAHFDAGDFELSRRALQVVERIWRDADEGLVYLRKVDDLNRKLSDV